jgi:hypothetical protein
MARMEFRKLLGEKIEAVDFGHEVSGQDFSNCRIEWCRGKRTSFKGCKFTHAVLRNCYLHQAHFENCDFTGCSFSETNLRGATFIGCDFRYASLRATAIEGKQILKNLPYWENARRELLRSLRKNAESLGDLEDVRRYLRAEMDASAEHWRSALRAVTPYYQSHYPGAHGKIAAATRLCGVKVSKWFWGYGESPTRLMSSTILWSIFVTALVVHNFNAWPSALKFTWATLLGFHVDAGASVGFWFTLLIAASRYIFIGLFATVFVRRFARR